jgi:membrane fusion protein (multidrug efflux system)
MKSICSLLFAVVFLAACSAPDPSNMSLDEKKVLLQELYSQQRSLEDQIKQLESEIAAIDPTMGAKRILVTSAPVQRKDFKHFSEVQGTIQSDNYLSASSETGGRILEMRVIEGQTVTKGQVIARIDLEQINKQIAEVETQLMLANDLFERQQRLWEQNIGSEVQFLQAKNNKERLEKALESLRFQLSKEYVYAPISGVVDQVLTKAGELASPGMPIARVLNTSQVKIVADVPETYLQSVRKGQKVQIRIPSLGMDKEATVTEVGRIINPNNRTFSVEIALNNSDNQLKPNLLALVLINDFTKPNSVVVPIELVQQEVGGKSYLLVQDSLNNQLIARKVYVETGRSYQGEILIESGLKGDETLIIGGARGLNDQDFIQVQQEG